MLRRLWQSAMIALARSAGVTRFVQGSALMSGLAERYVAGATARDGVRRAEGLMRQNGIRSSLFFLGEYVDDPAKIEQAVVNKIAVAGLLAEAGLDVHVSVDPTQIGASIDPNLLQDNADRIGGRFAATAHISSALRCLMIDMEDHTVVDQTIAAHDRLQARGVPVGITLQAYLRRTEADLAKLAARPSRVRLVKGAFVGSRDIAFTTQAEIKANFHRLIDLMFSPQARRNGFYPVVATHDDRLQAYARKKAAEAGWQPGEYEFEMLMGVRGDIAEKLAAAGEIVRLYVPFGQDWWPYAIRRIGENPRNAMLLARSLIN